MGIGLTSMGMMFVAIGLFFSALTRNQIVAAIWTFAAAVPADPAVAGGLRLCRRSAGRAGPRPCSSSRSSHQVNTFGSGQLDLRFLALHLSACVLMLYLTAKVLRIPPRGLIDDPCRNA